MGTERLVLRSDLPSPECSYRTHVLRMRIRCARVSTCSQRSPSNSDWCRSASRRSQDHESEHRSKRVLVDGAVQKHSDHGVELGQRQELQLRIRVALARRRGRARGPQGSWPSIRSPLEVRRPSGERP